MQTRHLGHTRESMPVLGFGTWPLAGRMGGVDRGDAVSLIRNAVDAGMSFIDTAEAYGDTEELLGRALADGYRNKVFLATKVSRDFTPVGVRRAAERSLSLMRTDVIDLYQVHRFEPLVPVEDTVGAIERLQKRGLVRHIGVSNYNVEQLERARSVTAICANQINYNALNRSPERAMIPYCKAHGISVVAHSSLAKGLLSGRYKRGHQFAADDERSTFSGYTEPDLSRYLAAVERITEVARAHDLTTSQTALAWVLRKPVIASVLTGPKTPDQLRELTTFADRLSDELVRSVGAAVDEVLDRSKLPYLCPFSDQLV